METKRTNGELPLLAQVGRTRGGSGLGGSKEGRVVPRRLLPSGRSLLFLCAILLVIGSFRLQSLASASSAQSEVATLRIAALEAGLAEVTATREKLARRVDEAETHTTKLVAHTEHLINDLATAKAGIGNGPTS